AESGHHRCRAARGARPTAEPFRRIDTQRSDRGRTSMTDIELTSDQVRWFAEISGDVNPLHVDEAHARMTPFGRPVAHGALVVLSCLAALPPRSGRLTSLDVAFPEPVFPDRTYSLSVQSGNDDAAAEERLSVTLLDGRRVVLELEAVFDTEPWDRSSPAEPLAVSA